MRGFGSVGEVRSLEEREGERESASTRRERERESRKGSNVDSESEGDDDEGKRENYVNHPVGDDPSRPESTKKSSDDLIRGEREKVDQCSCC